MFLTALATAGSANAAAKENNMVTVGIGVAVVKLTAKIQWPKAWISQRKLQRFQQYVDDVRFLS